MLLRFPVLNYQKIFNRHFWSSLKHLPRLVTRADKIILAAALVLILTGSFLLGHDHWLATTRLAPTFGGTLNEGVVGETNDLDKHVLRLTNAGLTRLADNGEIKGDIAESWEIADDGKTYNFKLREGFYSKDLAQEIKTKNVWPNIEIDDSKDNILTFKFKQPFSPFLNISSTPVFSYGPYKVIKEEKNRITLVSQENYWQGKTYIDKIVINLYPDEKALLTAVNRGDVDSFFTNLPQEGQGKNFRSFEMVLPRELILFFNLSRPNAQDVNLRRNLKDGKTLDKDITLELATSDTEKNIKIAEGLKEKWAGLRVTVNIKKYDKVVLQKDVIPQRNYDLLLYGLDYGPDADPYPFWHSSQNKPDGMNLSNYASKKSDKLLEEARQSLDSKVREDKYAQFRDVLNQEVPFIELNKETYHYYVSAKIQAVQKVFGSAEYDRFLSIKEWYIKSKRLKN